MKYLFFDTENANHFNGISKMCSLGYVLTDEKFNILDSDDIIINPEAKFEHVVIDDILYYSEGYYKSHKPFKDSYERIASLFDGSVVIGHAVDNDIKSLNDACKRYDLPYINTKFYDTQRIYMAINDIKPGLYPSLHQIAEDLNIERQGLKHKSVQDARITMEALRALCEREKIDIDTMLNKYPYTTGTTNNGVMVLDIKEREFDNHLRKINSKIFYSYLNSLKDKTSNKGILKDKVIAVSGLYEYTHFKEMLLILKNIYSLGGAYTAAPRKCNMFINYNSSDDSEYKCNRLNTINKEIENGRNIEIIDIDDFLSIINFNSDELEPFYNECKELYKERAKKSLEKNKNPRDSYNIGNLFSDFFNTFNSTK